MDLCGKHVLVTGADGFIGSHLVEALLELGAKVRAFVLYNSFDSWGWLDSLPPAVRDEIDVFMGDVRDPNGVRTAMEGIEVAFHLAALIGIPYSYHSPDSYVDTNVRGTLNVLQAARELDLERVVVTSTSEVYGTARYAPIDEQHPLQAQSPYSATKVGADKLAESFFLAFDLPVVTARPFNTYGPRQSARAVIPTIASQLLGDHSQLKLGSLEPIRDLTYVTDTCSGLAALACADEAVGRVVNLGTGEAVTIGELADRMIEMIRPGTEIVVEAERMRPAKSEVGELVSDNSLARKLAGWEPRVPLDEGLELTIAWIRENLDRFRLGYAL